MSSQDHSQFMRLAISEAMKAPPKPTNYCVGAVLVDEHSNDILSTGYTMELPGNTHAEQCCLQKFAESRHVSEEDVGKILPPKTVLYTTMEPCIERLSGNLPCVDRVIRTRVSDSQQGITKVYIGVQEPDTFVQQNSGRARLEQHGIESIHVGGFEDEISRIATSGHPK